MPSKRTPKPSSKGTARSSSDADVTEQFERMLKAAPEATNYILRLFITGSTPRSMSAIANIRALCDQYLAGHVELEVVDIYQQPAEAQGEQIIAAPTLVREFPAPPRRMVGDLSNAQKVLLGLNLIPQGAAASVSAANTEWIKL
jgi:circadian clock protein KaiB